jgi:hypothetical protein
MFHSSTLRHREDGFGGAAIERARPVSLDQVWRQRDLQTVCGGQKFGRGSTWRDIHAFQCGLIRLSNPD